MTGSVITQELQEHGNFGMYKLGEFVHYKSKITFRIAFYFRTNIKINSLKTFQRDFLWEFGEHFWLSAGYLVYLRLWLAVGWGTLQIYGMHNLKEFVHYKSTIIFSIHLAIPTKHRISSLGLKDS